MALYDAAETIKGLSEPQVKLDDGKVYTGRHISILEWQPYYLRLTDIQTRNDEKELRQFFEDVTRAMFKPKHFWQPDPTKRIIAHEQFHLMALDFLVCQASWVARLMNQKTPSSALDTSLPPDSANDKQPL